MKVTTSFENSALVLIGRNKAERLKNIKEYFISENINIDEYGALGHNLMVLKCKCGIEYSYPTIDNIPLDKFKCTCGFLLIDVHIEPPKLFDDLPNKPLDKELLDETRELLKKE